MDYPESLLAIVRNAAEQHRESVDEAVDCAEKAWLASDDYAETVAQMVRGELRSLIHGVRHRDNVALRTAAGVYGQAAKISFDTGAAERVARNCLTDYTICGVALGRITGKQLLSFAKTEQEKADGSAYNARLCRRLAELVPEDKAVSEVITAKKADAIMKQIANKRGPKGPRAA